MKDIYVRSHWRRERNSVIYRASHKLADTASRQNSDWDYNMIRSLAYVQLFGIDTCSTDLLLHFAKQLQLGCKSLQGAKSTAPMMAWLFSRYRSFTTRFGVFGDATLGNPSSALGKARSCGICLTSRTFPNIAATDVEI